MNKTVITIILIIIIAALVGLMVWFMVPQLTANAGWNSPVLSCNGISFNMNGFGGLSQGRLPAGAEKGESYEVPASQVGRLYLSFFAEDVEVTTWDKDTVRVEQVSNQQLADEDVMRFGMLGDEFAAESGNYGKTSVGIRPHSTIKLYIPENMGVSGEYDTLSGNLTVTGGVYTALDPDTTSGTVKLSGLTADHINADSTSGDLYVQGVRCDNIKVDTTSGVVEVAGDVTNEVDIDSTSGDISFKGSAAAITVDTASGVVAAEAGNTLRDFDVDSISGNISLVCSDASALRKIDIDTTSGVVSLTLPDKDGFTVDHDSVSGNRQIDFDMRNDTHGDGRIEIEVDSISGDLFINRY